MKKIIAIIFTISACYSFSQKLPKAYKENITKAEKCFIKKEYKQSAHYYSKAFENYDWKGLPNDRYNSACSWAMAGLIDSSFFQLLKIVQKSHFSDSIKLANEKSLSCIHNDVRWNQLLLIVQENYKKQHNPINKVLIERLDSIDKDDQRGRNELGKIEKKYGWESQEVKDQWKIINYKDSINQIKIFYIIDTYGWLGPDLIGYKGNATLFLVIQHADLKAQEKYLPLMQEAVKNGNANPADLALLEDRLALRQGKKQIYGSQIGMDNKNKKYYVCPLEDPDNVDKRRANVGLQPLANYVKYWKIKWDVEQYKKELSEIERIDKW